MNSVQARKNDRTFAPSDRVTVERVHFRTRFGTTLAGDLYKPKNAVGKLPALAVCGPFGAVKEQASGLYAQTMAERGIRPRILSRQGEAIIQVIPCRWRIPLRRRSQRTLSAMNHAIATTASHLGCKLEQTLNTVILNRPKAKYIPVTCG